MRKLLLVSTALMGVAMISAPASAAVKLDMGGFFRGYAVDADNDVAAERTNEFRRDTELHATGETTLDNGLTIGAHAEMKVANGDTSFTSDEIYAYASGGWGRVNLGLEDGAAYLLQVGAPSADSNVDGMRNYIDSTARATADPIEALANNNAFSARMDYDQADFSKVDRLTYLSPKFNGFQAGLSYAPNDVIANNIAAPGVDPATMVITTLIPTGINGYVDADATDAAVSGYEDLIEVSARWDGEYQGFGIGIGAGYSTSDLPYAIDTSAVALAAADIGDYWISKGTDTYNVGVNFASQGFSLGGSYMLATTERQTDVETTAVGDAIELVSGNIDRTTYVVGAGYDNGPYHAGVSYLNQQTDYDALAGDGVDEDENAFAASSFEVDKYTLGGGYTFGPGMTFRGSVAWGDFTTSTGGAENNGFQQVAIGADIQF